MNICSYCLVESEAVVCKLCSAGTMIALDVFIEGVSLEELDKSREHWRTLPAEYRPPPEAHRERLDRFDAIIRKVREARKSH